MILASIKEKCNNDIYYLEKSKEKSPWIFLYKDGITGSRDLEIIKLKE